jgi:hypothetical protein
MLYVKEYNILCHQFKARLSYYHVILFKIKFYYGLAIVHSVLSMILHKKVYKFYIFYKDDALFLPILSCVLTLTHISSTKSLTFQEFQ